MLSFPAARRIAPLTSAAALAEPAAPVGPAVFVLERVGVSIEGTPVLRGLDLTGCAGEVIGVTGANGSGKSTLLAVLATLLAPGTGSGLVLGAQLGTRECVAVRPRIAMIGHRPALYPALTLRENLHLAARLTEGSARAADDALRSMGLERAGDRRTDRCSQGMQRRAELARVLAAEPSLLLLDEVHSGLDTTSVDVVEEAIRRVRSRGGVCVLVSHEPGRLRTLTDRIVEVVAGRAKGLDHVSGADERRMRL
jgi:heme exporter protein A